MGIGEVRSWIGDVPICYGTRAYTCQNDIAELLDGQAVCNHKHTVPVNLCHEAFLEKKNHHSNAILGASITVCTEQHRSQCQLCCCWLEFGQVSVVVCRMTKKSISYKFFDMPPLPSQPPWAPVSIYSKPYPKLLLHPSRPTAEHHLVITLSRSAATS